MTTRRAPGSGHLFTRRDTAGNVTWYGKWTADGRQIKRRLGPKRGRTGHGLDRREAERKLRVLMEEVTPPPTSRVGVEQAGRQLIAHLEALGRKPTTIEAAESLLRVHLVPFFSGRSLDAITADDLEAFMRAKGRENKSPKTIRNALGFLHSIFEFSRRKGWARSNPCKFVDKPRAESSGEIRFLDAEELEAVVRAEREREDELSQSLALMYRTAGMTGLRQGELIALRVAGRGLVSWTTPGTPVLCAWRVHDAEVQARFTGRPAGRRAGWRAGAPSSAVAVPDRRRPRLCPSGHGQAARPCEASPQVRGGGQTGRGSPCALPRSAAQFRHADGQRRRADADLAGVDGPCRLQNDPHLRRLRTE
jgi:hypothetical protein